MSTENAPSAPTRRTRLGSKTRKPPPSPRDDDEEPAPPRPARDLSLAFAVGGRIAGAYLGLVLVAVIEVYAVGILRSAELAGPHELSRAVRGLLPIAIAIAAPIAVVSGALVEVLVRADKLIGRAIATASAGVFAAVVGYGVASGRHFEGGRRAPFALALGALAALAASMLAPRVAALLRRAEDACDKRGVRPAALFVAALGLAIVAIEVANARVLPRLYPAFHLGLTAIAAMIASLSALVWRAFDPPGSSRGPAVRASLGLVIFALGAALAQRGAKSIAGYDNVRIVYATHAPIMGRVVEVAAELAPPPPLDDAPLDDRAIAGASPLRWDGRDILLITVDALRADHAGAYGYARPVTPNLDKLAAGGVVFESAYSPTPHTSYAITSVMTGKYLRPLLLQGLGEGSDTWAGLLRRYGYRTAAFYPPAIFFIDGDKFAGFRDRGLDFEYRRVEFASAADRAGAVTRYLASAPADHKLFLWVHLFEPHEPYEAHPEHPFGDRDLDRYDAEIAAADAGIGAIVGAVRAARPGAVVIVTADHGEEFSEHGGRYHGTTVYEEQVRVPLVVNAQGLAPRRVRAPAQLVDLLPTVLSALDIPRPARVRGADLGAVIAGKAEDGEGFAFSETDTMTLLAKRTLRLVCARRISACALYDVAEDPGETTDLGAQRPADLAAMRAELRRIEASHGKYEQRGERGDQKSLPEALRRGIAGDGDAALDVAALLDDADVAIRRRAAQVLFDLRRPDVTAQIRLALVRDEDEEVRRYCALALTRLGEGASKTRELVTSPDLGMRRLAALALAESGDARGEDVLIAWLREGYPPKPDEGPRPKPVPIPFERARELVAALGKIHAKNAVIPLLAALDDVRLRPDVARALAAIGEGNARPDLAFRLKNERYPTARTAIAEALVKLGGGPELRIPIVRFLGTPDPLPNGLKIAMDAGIVDLIGGPRERDLAALRRFATSGVAAGMIIPKLGKGEDPDVWRGLRAICRAKSKDGRAGEVRVGLRLGPRPTREHDGPVPVAAPEMDPTRSATLRVPVSAGPVEVFATLPETVTLVAGEYGDFVVYATQNIEVSVCAVVPLTSELPPPPPEPWDAGAAEP